MNNDPKDPTEKPDPLWEDEEVLPMWMDDDLYMMNLNEADDYRDEMGDWE